MPTCKICKARIEISRTGILAYKCRICGKTVCISHFDITRSTCINCAKLRKQSSQ